MQSLWHIENIYHLCFSDLKLFFTFIQSGESIYEPPPLKIVL